MAITLESVAAPGATPIANNAASAKAFANNYSKLAQIPSRDRRTILVLQMLTVLSSTGADYRNNHKGLIQDAAVYTRGLNIELEVYAALGSTSQRVAVAADATFSNDIPTLLGVGRDFANLSDDELTRIIAFLAAQLGL